MIQNTFIEHSDIAHTVDIPEGMSLIQAAVNHNVPSIDADCGGSMTPVEIRRLKRSIRNVFAGDASWEDMDRGRSSAIALLEHSILRRHKRLAVIRFAEAIRTCAPITQAHWQYCEAVIASMGDSKLRQLVLDAIDDVTGNMSLN